MSSMHAFLFDLSGAGGVTLGDEFSVAYSINNNGQIVGEDYNKPYTITACLFDPTGGWANIDLGALPAYSYYSRATSINDNGRIVGWASNSSDYDRACLFDPTGGGANIDLNTLIDPSSGWVLSQASCINNSGWIVGYGTNPDGDSRAYLLTPEPTSAAIMSLGVFALRRRRR